MTTEPANTGASTGASSTPVNPTSPTTPISPLNLSAQLHYSGAGNPPSALPDSAISNAFPGLEFDFRNIWRRLLVGIELHESDNYVVDAQEPFLPLKGRRLLSVAGQPVVTELFGPQRPGADPVRLTTADNPAGVTMLEWSNSLAEVLAGHQGSEVECRFTGGPAERPARDPAEDSAAHPGSSDEQPYVANLRVRPLFAQSQGQRLAVLDEAVAGPGDLTRGLCSPWQNDYRECACYYWAASRPDYVNVEEDDQGTSVGNHWFALDREPKEYVLDDRQDSRLVSYSDLFQRWQSVLRFIVAGNDAPEHRQTAAQQPEEPS